MKKVLVINGHPDKQSYNYALSESYFENARQSDAKVDQINIADLVFNPNLQYGFRKRMELEPDLREAVRKIQHADHLVWVFPVWWYGYPSLMKGFVDRTFLPGIAYEYDEGKLFPRKLWKGKSARIIVTADTPVWYDWLIMKRPTLNQFKKGTLEFCGINPVKVTYIAPLKDSTVEFRKKWLNKVGLLGERLS